MPDPGPAPSSPSDEPPLEALVVRYLDRQLSDAELAQLNARLAAREEEREAFVQVCTQTWELREMLKTRRAAALAGGTVLGDDDDGSPSGEREGMNESMVLPAVHEADLVAADEPEPAEVVRIPRPADRRERTVWSLARRYGWVAAAVVMLAGGVMWWALQPAPAATLAGAANAVWETQPVPMTPGAVLPAGKPLRLKSGLAELTFGGGVRVILEGPAELTPVDPRGATLTHGKLRAHVPHGAEGFRVSGAGLDVTDLGTEFGMSVARAAGVAEVHVFDGKVEVGLPAPQAGQPQTQAMQLSRDDALRCLASSATAAASVERIPARPELFVEDIHRPRLPYAIRGTGAGLAIGEVDPQWTILPGEGDDTFAPQPAYVAPVDPGVHRANEPRTSQWISNGPNFPPVPKVAAYRFRTRLDLSGFDPATVVIRARVVMDDELLDVRLNGASTGRSLAYRELDSRQNFGEVVLDKGFVAGPNDVEFVVKNVQANSQLGLRVEWAASGLRTK